MIATTMYPYLSILIVVIVARKFNWFVFHHINYVFHIQLIDLWLQRFVK